MKKNYFLEPFSRKKGKEFFQKTFNFPIFYICNDPLWALGLENFLPYFHILCIDNRDIIDYLLAKNIKVFSLARELKKHNPIFRNTKNLLDHPLTKKYLAQHYSSKINQYLMPFKNTAAIQIRAQKINFKVVGALPKLNRFFEHKGSFDSFMKKNSLPYIPSLQTTLKKNIYSQIKEKWGVPFIIQFNRGFAGSSTHKISSLQDFEKLLNKFPGRSVKISRYIEGKTFTINACATKYGTLMSPIAYQITGLPDFTPHWGGTCGASWLFPNIPKELKKKVFHTTSRVGKLMYQKGFKGIFGLDLIWEKDTNQIFLIENNARFIATIPMFTKMEIAKDTWPLLTFHLLELLDIDYQINAEQYNYQQQQQRYGSHLILRNVSDQNIKIKRDLPSGSYYWNQKGKKLIFKEKIYSLAQLEEDYLIITYPSRREITPMQEYARFRSWKNFFKADSFKLKEEVKNVALQIKRNLFT